MQRTTPRFDPDTLGDKDRARQDRRVVLTIIAGVGLGLGAMFLMPWTRADLRDTAGAPVQSATGRITRVSYIQGQNQISANPFYVNELEIDGKQLNADAGMFTQELKKGQRVRFTYLAGKSGRWYLQSIQPE